MTINVSVPITINVTGGETEYVGGTLYDPTGKDISAGTYDIGFVLSVNGVATVPVGTQWIAAPGATTTSTIGTAPFTDPNTGILVPLTAQRILHLLVPATQTAGAYSCWGRLHDSPEILARLLQDNITVK